MPQAASATCLRHSAIKFLLVNIAQDFCAFMNYDYEYDRQNPVMRQTKDMVAKAKARALKKNLPFDIDLPYIRSIVPSHCPVFDIPLEWSRRRGASPVPLSNSPSLDRIDPERGYVKGNVWIISHKANAIKNSATHEELKLVTKAVGEALVNSLEF